MPITYNVGDTCRYRCYMGKIVDGSQKFSIYELNQSSFTTTLITVSYQRSLNIIFFSFRNVRADSENLSLTFCEFARYITP